MKKTIKFLLYALYYTLLFVSFIFACIQIIISFVYFLFESLCDGIRIKIKEL